MKASDVKLQASLMEAMKLDDARLEEELQNCEPHVFSESFENRMEELMKVQKRKRKRANFARFAATAAAVVLLVGGVLCIGSEQLRASAISIDIREWLEKFFTVEDGVSGQKDEEVLFDETQIGYIPEGFEKVFGEKTFSVVFYKFQNETGDFFTVRVERNKLTTNIDNEGAKTEVKVNGSGYEYTLIYRDDAHDGAIMWKDQADAYYSITGTVGSDELVKIMDGISY